MKKVLSLVLAAILLTLTLVGCGASNDVASIQKKGELMVYTEAGFAPYEFIYNNEIVGVDIEIMKAVADKLGVELKVKDVAFDTITTSVESGKAHCGAAAITISPERMESVDFSVPYSSTEQYLIVAADNTEINHIEDLVGKNVGVQNGTTSDILIEGLINDGTLGGTILTPYNTPALAAASIGKVDAVVTDKLTAEIIVSNNSGLRTVALTYANGNVAQDIEEYGICVAKGNEELLNIINEVINELLANGQIEAWVTEYSAKATEAGA